MKSRKVLVVEDDKMLATVFSMFLKDLGHELIGFCTNGEDAIKKCSEIVPDVMLMDIHLAGKKDGIKVTEEIQKLYDVPVIYVSGDTDKDTVQRALQTKSYGYLIKPVDKTELGINIELACAKHHYDKEIHVREKRYRTLIDVSPNTILVIVNGKIEYVNYSGLKLFQTIHIEELLEKPFLNFVPESFHKVLNGHFEQLLSKEITKLEVSPAKIKSLNQKTLTVGIIGSLIEFKNETAIQLVISDHTENIETQRLLKEQSNIIENMYDGIITLSLSGSITSMNKGAERILGIERDNMKLRNIVSLFPNYDNQTIQEIFLEETLDRKNHETVIDYFRERTKESLHLQFTLSILSNLGNEIAGIVCYFRDITDWKKNNERLLTSENNLKAIFDGSTDAIFFINNKFQIIDSNRLAKQYAQKFFNQEINVGQPVMDVMKMFGSGEFESLFDNALDGISHFLERFFIVDDKPHFFKITIYPIVNQGDEEINRFCISLQDITEKKKTERELAETHAELKPLFDSSIQRFYLADLDYRLVAFNKAAKEIVQIEYKRNLKKGDSLLDFVPLEVGMENFKEKFERAKGGKHVEFKVKLSSPIGEYWAEAHLDPIRDETGETKRVLFWTLDVSDREENLAALRKSEERYALVASGGNDGLWDWDMITDELYVSPRWKAVVGYEENEQITRQNLKEKIIHPEDAEKVKEVLDRYLYGDLKTYKNEYRVKDKDGNYHWILERGVAHWDTDGKPVRMAGSITDITDRKKAEQEIYEANTALLEERRMFIKGNVVVFRVNAHDFIDIKYVSENVEEVLGYPHQDFIDSKIDFNKLIYHEDIARHDSEREEAVIKGKDHIDFTNYRLIRKDGSIIWVKDSTSIIRDENGTVVQLLGYIVDISKEKEAEERLAENQKKYFSLFNEASDAILIVDNDEILDCNSKALELFGFERDKFIGQHLLKLSPELQTKNETSESKRLRKLKDITDGKSKTFHWIYKKSNGELFDAEVSISFIIIGEKKFLHAIVRDITARKKIENSLRESEEKNRALLHAISDNIFVLDKDGNYLDYREDNKSGLAIEREKVIGKNLTDFFSGDTLIEFQQKVIEAIEKDVVQKLDYKLSSPKGERWFETKITRYMDVKAMLLARDVTERVEMETKIKQINAELEEKVEQLSKSASAN